MVPASTSTLLSIVKKNKEERLEEWVMYNRIGLFSNRKLSCRTCALTILKCNNMTKCILVNDFWRITLMSDLTCAFNYVFKSPKIFVLVYVGVLKMSRILISKWPLKLFFAVTFLYNVSLSTLKSDGFYSAPFSYFFKASKILKFP